MSLLQQAPGAFLGCVDKSVCCGAHELKTRGLFPSVCTVTLKQVMPMAVTDTG